MRKEPKFFPEATPVLDATSDRGTTSSPSEASRAASRAPPSAHPVTRTVIIGGPLAGSSGILVERPGGGRCLVRLDDFGGDVLLEMDERFVRSVSPP